DAFGLRDVIAVLPGSRTQGHKVVFVEAHLDSRCADLCDPSCSANGADDNGSGSVLVIELARVLSKYTFNHTIVFMLVTGEEHGLLGSRAMAQFCTDQGIEVKAVQNNDIVGGTICGHTASPPGCDIPDEIDSTQVRLFSHGTTRGLAQMLALSYNEKLHSEVPVPMLVSVMDREDRVGRGSDHIPFREAGFQSMRFCAANEHGNGDPTTPGYIDHQHTSGDVLGADTDGNSIIDSFYVDFNYLQRNTVINGMGLTLLALGPETPDYDVLDEPTGLRVQVNNGSGYSAFRVGVRPVNGGASFEALYRTDQTSFIVPGLLASHVYYVSVAGVDANGITSIFGPEVVRANDATTEVAPVDDLPYGLDCLPIGINESNGWSGTLQLSCGPNPFSGSTAFRITGDASVARSAVIVIRDLFGRSIASIRVASTGSAIAYEHQPAAGLYFADLIIDGRRADSLRLVAVE
ncbi:MAG TPA: M20/M25/M40 family metallo-hydrolase, partial [Flavobacteriales bacterium]|nr:M20/M25/M40 family metallo-hydrolase [Flavobacteriales bacterium]